MLWDILSNMSKTKIIAGKGRAMIKQDSKKALLQDERVVGEINQHKWFESEKVGHDIGFEKAAEDWINRFSKKWLEKNSGEKKRESGKEQSSSRIRK